MDNRKPEQFDARLLRQALVPDEPWRNGAGSTRTLWRLGPAQAPVARISVARIERAAPFSHLPGLERTLCLLGPGVLVLDLAGREVRLEPGQWISFPGEAAVAAVALDVPVRAFNVMTARDRARHRVAVAKGAQAQALLAVLEPDGALAGAEPGDLLLPPHPAGLSGQFLAIGIDVIEEGSKDGDGK